MSANLTTEFGERLATLPNGTQGIRAGLNTEVTEGTEGTEIGLIDFRSSDDTLDRYDEVIVASGWRLENYRKNPVVQNAHQYGDIIHTIGKSLVTEVRGNHLFQRVQFAIEANPLAALAYKLYKGKYLRAVSVGFVPVKWENGTAETKYRRKYTEQELLEVSAVGIPANPNALELAVKAGAVEKSDLRELAGFLQDFCDGKAGARRDPGARGSGSDGARSEQQTKELIEMINNVRKHINKL